MLGKVKWFNIKKGYGFITSDEGNDYFFHYTAINKEGFKSLAAGASVKFSVKTEDGKEFAVDISEV